VTCERKIGYDDFACMILIWSLRGVIFILFFSHLKLCAMSICVLIPYAFMLISFVDFVSTLTISQYDIMGPNELEA